MYNYIDNYTYFLTTNVKRTFFFVGYETLLSQHSVRQSHSPRTESRLRRGTSSRGLCCRHHRWRISSSYLVPVSVSGPISHFTRGGNKWIPVSSRHWVDITESLRGCNWTMVTVEKPKVCKHHLSERLHLNLQVSYSVLKNFLNYYSWGYTLLL